MTNAASVMTWLPIHPSAVVRLKSDHRTLKSAAEGGSAGTEASVIAI